MNFITKKKPLIDGRNEQYTEIYFTIYYKKFCQFEYKLIEFQIEQNFNLYLFSVFVIFWRLCELSSWTYRQKLIYSEMVWKNVWIHFSVCLFVWAGVGSGRDGLAVEENQHESLLGKAFYELSENSKNWTYSESSSYTIE